jgi:hypothetical protein
VTAEAPEVECPVCGDPVAPGPEGVLCGLCGAPHHGPCFEYTGRCSIYGCGGITVRPFEVALTMVQAGTIDESAPEPGWLGPWIAGLPRRAARHVDALPRTMGAGIVGAVVTVVAYPLLWWMLGRSAAGSPGEPLLPVILGAAFAHGLLAPFLAPLQHRFPRETAGWGLIVCWMLFTFGELWRGPDSGMLFPFFAAGCVLGALVFATSVAELVAGQFTRFGRRLGRSGPVVRALVAALAFVVGTGVPSQITGILLRGAWRDILVFSLMAGVVGAPSMEVGRAEYRKKLIAAAEG